MERCWRPPSCLARHSPHLAVQPETSVPAEHRIGLRDTWPPPQGTNRVPVSTSQNSWWVLQQLICTASLPRQEHDAHWDNTTANGAVGFHSPKIDGEKGKVRERVVGVTVSMGFMVLIKMSADMVNLMLGWLRKWSRLILEMYSLLSQSSWRGDMAGSLGVSPHPMGCRRGPTLNPIGGGCSGDRRRHGSWKRQSGITEVKGLMWSRSLKLVRLQSGARGRLVEKDSGRGTRASTPRAALLRCHQEHSQLSQQRPSPVPMCFLKLQMGKLRHGGTRGHKALCGHPQPPHGAHLPHIPPSRALPIPMSHRALHASHPPRMVVEGGQFGLRCVTKGA